MVPTLSAGDEVMVDYRAYGHTQPIAGDIVIARNPSRPEERIVKRITAVTPDGRFQLQGDNPDPTQSTDSRQYGPVPRHYILGKVTSRH